MTRRPVGGRDVEPLRPAFLVTIDTEGDNLWSRPLAMTTRNARCVGRFQALCEAFGVRPTWLVDYEMALDPVLQEFGRDLLRRRAGEIGMHLHAWNTPPLSPLTGRDLEHQPFLTDFDEPAIAAKVAFLTDLLEETFEIPIVSHRAGRWAFSAAYMSILHTRGFRADCSVTPHISWRHATTAPGFPGGGDFTGCSEDPYVLANGPQGRLWEIPMTVRAVSRGLPAEALRRVVLALPGRLGRRAANFLLPTAEWLRPNGRNLQSMQRLVREGVAHGRPHLELMIHSSELMAGGSPRFPKERHIERLYHDLEQVFAVALDAGCRPKTLSEYADALSAECDAANGGSSDKASRRQTLDIPSLQERCPT